MTAKSNLHPHTM